MSVYQSSVTLLFFRLLIRLMFTSILGLGLRRAMHCVLYLIVLEFL